MLHDFFSVIGEVAIADIISSKTGRHLGIGYVQFSNPASVELAISQLNNQVLQGRTITVREYYQNP